MESAAWYDSMPDLYRAEIETLQNGIQYLTNLKEIPREYLSGMIGFTGELSYGYNKTFPIRILFPHGYPYCSPHIIPLEKVIINNKEQLLPKSFGKGNQYSSDGRMCLYREEEDWMPFHDGIGTTLKQAVKWLEAATSENGFTADKIVEEYNPELLYKGQVLFNLNSIPEFSSGVIYLKRFKDNYYSLTQIQLSIGKNITILPSIQDATVLTPTTSQTIVARCFRLNEEPKKILPNLINSEYFKLLLVGRFNTSIIDLLPSKGENPTTVVAFALGKKRELHFFQLTRIDFGVEVQFQLHYLLPKNLSSELFVRIKDILNPDILSNKSVMIVGLGSIGSVVATELAASDIGNFTVIDEEIFEAGNSVRHAADLLNIGESKAEVAKKLIQAKNPNAKVTSINNSIFDIDRLALIEMIKNIDVVLDFTANGLVEAYLSELVLQIAKKPFIQAAVSMGGFSGIVSIFIPNETACPSCQKKQGTSNVPLSSVNTKAIKETKPDYGPCSKPALPASGIDSKEVALQAARITLQFLMKNKKTIYPALQGTQYYWHGPAGSTDLSGKSWDNALSWDVATIPPNESCEICSPKNVKINNSHKTRKR